MKIVIIGGVAAGPRAAARVKRLLPEAEVTLINDSRQLSYSACGLPYYASGDIDNIRELFKTSFGVVRDEKYFNDVKGVKVLAPFKAERIDRDKMEIHIKNVDDGRTVTIPYDRLILATGARPHQLNIPGCGSERVKSFSRPEDAESIRKLAEKGRLGSVCIIGAGFIGCELSESFAGLWGIGTTIIEAEPHILPAVLDEEMAAHIAAEMVRNGVTVHCNTKVEKFEEEGDSLIIHFKGFSLTVDQAIVVIGFTPNTELARDSGLEIGKTGGIKVNTLLQTTDSHIYAGGDCVENHHLILDRGCLLPLGSIANRHGRMIANNIAGRNGEFPGVVGSFIVKVFDYNVAAAGITEGAARENGFDVGCVWGSFPDRAEYYPEWKYIYLKMVYDRRTKKLLGLQAVGPGDVTRRVDMFSYLLHRRGTLNNLYDIEAAYSPPYSSALDPLYVMGCIAGNSEEESINMVSPAFLDNNKLLEGATIIDVREDEERESNPIKIGEVEVIEIPLGDLRTELPGLEMNGKALVVCHRGVRGYEAVRILKNAGFEDAAFIGGGMSFVNAMKVGEE